MWGIKLNYALHTIQKKIFSDSFTKHISYVGLLSFIVGISQIVFAVPTLEIMSSSGTNTSSASLNDKTITFVFNPANPTNNITQPYFPTTKVTYSISDNPYTGSSIDGYGLFYSANSFVALKDQGFPTNYSAYSNTFSSKFNSRCCCIRSKLSNCCSPALCSVMGAGISLDMRCSSRNVPEPC